MRLPKNWRRSGPFQPGNGEPSPELNSARRGFICTVTLTMLGATRLTTPAKLADSIVPRFTVLSSRFRLMACLAWRRGVDRREEPAGGEEDGARERRAP